MSQTCANSLCDSSRVHWIRFVGTCFGAPESHWGEESGDPSTASLGRKNRNELATGHRG